MKNLIKKLSSTNISKTYMFILLGVSALMMTGYFSYAWFTVQGVQKYSVVTGNLTGTLAIGSNTANINGAGVIEYTPTTNNDTLTVTVTNSSDRTVKNSLYYYTLSASSITIGYTSDTSTVPSIRGVSVDKGKSLTYKIKIASAKGKTIRIGSSMGLVNSNLTLPTGASTLEQFSQTVSRTLLTGVGNNGTIDTTDPEQTFITGTNPNNYIWYSGKLWRAVSIDPSDNSVKLVTQWNISAFPYDLTDIIAYSAFKGSYMEQWLNDTSVDGFLGNLREPDKFIKKDSVWNATLTSVTTKPEKTTMVTDAVGLLNIYEYTMSYKNATDSTGYLNNGLYWWTLSPSGLAYVNYVSNRGYGISDRPTNSYGSRPSINLKSAVKIIDGNGTSNNPYKLQGDNDSPTGALLSTRYSGEYISFGTGKNNLYRIVSHENGTGTKITSAIPLKDSGNYKKMAFGSNVTFSKDNTIGAFLNGDYLTGGTYLTRDQANMIEDNTTWYLGTVGDANYKLAKYQDATGSNLTKSTTTAKIGLLRLGELMAGQFDKNGNNTDYWTLTPYSTSYVRNVGNYGNGHNLYSPTDSTGSRPSMNLKSTVKIVSGTGTKSDPFQLSVN
ncbi:MAG: hypothetical protein LKJ84_02130 [Bacilli bacterium]|nr:hypothetical protein [Bacilli bacterium]